MSREAEIFEFVIGTRRRALFSLFWLTLPHQPHDSFYGAGGGLLETNGNTDQCTCHHADSFVKKSGALPEGKLVRSTDD